MKPRLLVSKFFGPRVLFGPRLAPFCAACLLVGCASAPLKPIAGDFPNTPTPVELTAIAEALPLPPAIAPGRKTRAGKPVKQITPLQALAAANVAARQRPAPDGFNAARQVFSYRPGALFELYANPNYVSTILLEPGETLNNIAAGDTARWMVTQAESETQSEPRTIVLVKPQATGVRTNIVLITDRRTYLIEAISQAGAAYAAQVAWDYPKAGAATFAGASADKLNSSYRIRTLRGRKPVWTPTRVFDDGRRTWIEFSPDVVAADLPPLFVITGEGAELVNYRVVQSQGTQRYMVDRVFDRAELRLGARDPIIVRIDRKGARS